MALHYSVREEAQFSPIYHWIKFDDNVTDWESSSLLGLSRRGEIYLRLIVYGVVTAMLATLGIVGNSLTILVLTRKSMRSPISYFLCGLAVTDLTVCVILIPFLSVSNIWSFLNEVNEWEGQLASLSVTWIMPWFHALTRTCVVSSVYFTVAVTIERYVAVCHPFKAAAVFNCRRARFVGLGIFVFAIVYSLPRWWELELMEIRDPTSQAIIGYRPVPSSLRTNPVYDIYYFDISFILLIVFIPIVTMCVLNAKIYLVVRRANRDRQKLSQKQKQENSVARMLLIIVSLTLAAYTMAIVEAVGKKFIAACNGPCLELQTVRDFFAFLNCSLNFFVYCLKSSKFQATLIDLWPSGLKRTLGRLRSSSAITGTSEISHPSAKVSISVTRESQKLSQECVLPPPAPP